MEHLREFYPEPPEQAVLKEMPCLDDNCRDFIAASPFVLMATSGESSVDCSPRGDHAGFVHVADDKTLHIADLPGNNRLDSLKNIIENPNVGLLFLIPGIPHTLRIKGKAKLSIAPHILESLATRGRNPRCVIVIDIEVVFVQCASAVKRANLWNPETFADTDEVPSMKSLVPAHMRRGPWPRTSHQMKQHVNNDNNGEQEKYES